MPNDAPRTRDYSRRVTRRVVLRETVEHPLVLIPAAVGVLGGLGVLLLASAGPVAAGVAGAGLATSALVAALRRRLYGDAYASRYHQRLRERFHALTRRKLEELQRKLKELGCDAGVRQLYHLADEMDSFREVLRSKLGEGDLTCSQYLGTAEEIYLMGLGNLEQVAGMLTNLRNTDPADIERRIRSLEKQTGSPASVRECSALRERLALCRGEQEVVRELLAQNEEAITVLDKTTAAVSRITVNAAGSTTMDDAMAELRALAELAPHYSS